jgi:hypothetical protein
VQILGEIRVCFLYEIEKIGGEVGRIIKAVQRWVRPAMHSKRAVGFVILTEEAPQELMQRLGPVLEGITSVENWWCHTVLSDVVGRHGSLDPLTTYVLEAWEVLRERNNPKYVRQPEVAETIIVGNMENFDRRAAIQMGIKARRSRKTTQKSNGP